MLLECRNRSFRIWVISDRPQEGLRAQALKNLVEKGLCREIAECPHLASFHFCKHINFTSVRIGPKTYSIIVQRKFSDIVIL